MKNLSGLAFSLFVIIIACVGVQAQISGVPVEKPVPESDKYSAVSKKLLERVANGDAPGYSVAVIRNGKIEWEQGVGWADKDAAVPFTSRTPIALASISKSLTAAAIDVLASKGRLNTDDPVSKYLGKGWGRFPLTDAITISQLLKQTSGIPHYFQYEYPDEPGSLYDRGRAIRQFGIAVSKPGERFIYTNLGYSILASVAAKAGSGELEEVMERELFGPLGMKETKLSAWMSRDGAAKGYGRDGSALDFAFRLAPDGGAGFFSTAHDLAVYSLFQLGERAPKGYRPVPIQEYLRRTKGSAPFSYDRGWGILKHKGDTFLISDGQMSGSSTAIVLAPEEKLAVVVVCNRTGGPALEAAMDMLEAAKKGLGESFKTAVAAGESFVSIGLEVPFAEYDGHIAADGKNLPISIRKASDGYVMTFRGKDVEMRNAGWDRGSLQLIVNTGLERDPGEDEFRRLVFSLWPEGDHLKGFVLDEFYNERPRRGFPYKVELKRSDRKP